MLTTTANPIESHARFVACHQIAPPVAKVAKVELIASIGGVPEISILSYGYKVLAPPTKEWNMSHVNACPSLVYQGYSARILLSKPVFADS